MSPIGNILRFIFTTNSSYWLEKELNDKIIDIKAKKPVEIDIYSTDKTIEWLKSQSENWVVHSKEIYTAKKYNHCWPSASINKKIIGCIKIGFGNVYIFDFNKIIKLPDKMAFIYDTYVLPEFRNKDIAKFLITNAVRFIKEKGYKKVRCHIPPWNKNSINAYEKIGFKKYAYIRYFRILGISFQITWYNKDFPSFKRGRIMKGGMPH